MHYPFKPDVAATMAHFHTITSETNVPVIVGDNLPACVEYALTQQGE